MNPVEMAAKAAPMVSSSETPREPPKFTLPAPGRAMLRFVSYIELGKQSSAYQGEFAIKPKVCLEFELVGSRHEPVAFNGKVYPHKVRIVETLSMDSRSNLKKLFLTMRGGREEITHLSQMLGEPFIGVVVHEPKMGGGCYVRLRDKSGYTIKRPFIEKDGEALDIEVPMGIMESKVFIWDFPTLDTWSALYTPNRKQSLQLQIMGAVNYKGSPLEKLIGVDTIEVPPDPFGNGNRPRRLG